MAESTNANHSDPGKRTDIMLDDRIEHGYSSAEQRPSGTMIDILRYGVANTQWQRTWVANAPCRPTIVCSSEVQWLWSPAKQRERAMQLPEHHPSPTV